MRLLRSILSATVVLITIASAEEPPRLKNASKARPNIVFFLADDHSWHDYGFAGNEKVKTPAVDALAGESMVFEQAFTV